MRRLIFFLVLLASVAEGSLQQRRLQPGPSKRALGTLRTIHTKLSGEQQLLNQQSQLSTTKQERGELLREAKRTQALVSHTSPFKQQTQGLLTSIEQLVEQITELVQQRRKNIYTLLSRARSEAKDLAAFQEEAARLTNRLSRLDANEGARFRHQIRKSSTEILEQFKRRLRDTRRPRQYGLAEVARAEPFLQQQMRKILRRELRKRRLRDLKEKAFTIFVDQPPENWERLIRPIVRNINTIAHNHARQLAAWLRFKLELERETDINRLLEQRDELGQYEMPDEERAKRKRAIERRIRKIAERNLEEVLRRTDDPRTLEEVGADFIQRMKRNLGNIALDARWWQERLQKQIAVLRVQQQMQTIPETAPLEEQLRRYQELFEAIKYIPTDQAKGLIHVLIRKIRELLRQKFESLLENKINTDFLRQEGEKILNTMNKLTTHDTPRWQEGHGRPRIRSQLQLKIIENLNARLTQRVHQIERDTRLLQRTWAKIERVKRIEDPARRQRQFKRATRRIEQAYPSVVQEMREFLEGTPE